MKTDIDGVPVRTGLDCCFGIASRALAAVKDGQVVAVVSLGDVPYYSTRDAMKRVGAKRMCPRVCRAFRAMNAAAEKHFREQAGEVLGRLGAVVAGYGSCGEFCRDTGETIPIAGSE